MKGYTGQPSLGNILIDDGWWSPHLKGAAVDPIALKSIIILKFKIKNNDPKYLFYKQQKKTIFSWYEGIFILDQNQQRLYRVKTSFDSLVDLG